ncbi:hypothetical protein ASF63_04405 [Microbacterium sp. Leaf320]|nr:hypothetical protein ASF63_04405 [Microbacterium sp. Leaf320]
MVEAIAAHPDRPLTLFAEWGSRTASAIRVAAALGHSWAPAVDDYLPCAALILPAELARGFDDFAVMNSTVEDPDDVVLFDYLRALGSDAIAPVDGPVEHDGGDSLVGNSTMGVRKAVRYVASRHAATHESVLTGLTAVPHYDWWEQQAVMFIQDASSPDGWARVRSGPAFEHLGIGTSEVDDALEGALRDVPDRDALDDRVSAIIVREVWKTAYLLGAVIADHGAGLEDDDRFLGALSTLAPGALRRIVPAHLLTTIAELLRPVVILGAGAGIRSRSVKRENGETR